MRTVTPAAAARPTPPAPAPVVAAERPAPSTPAPRYPNAVTRARIDELLARIEDAYFDYDRAALRPDALKALQADSTELRDILKDFPDYKLTIEGHCDERGSAEYNVALGEKRAEAAKDYLVQVGIPSAQLNLVSYGKERPICEEHDEACWQRNRRIHIVATAQTR
jgi:peptidoglycan-associated lipoprotein